MEVTLTLEIPASSREALQQILDTVTTYDLIEMATSMREVIEPSEPEPPSHEAQRKLLKAYFPWIDSNEEAEGSDAIDTLSEWWDNVGGEVSEPDERPRSECGNCAEVWADDELVEIQSLNERMSPGDTYPSGQCPDPDCGALCTPTTHPITASMEDDNE